MSHPWRETHDAKEEAIDDAFTSSPSLFCARLVPPLPHATEEEGSEHMGNLSGWTLVCRLLVTPLSPLGNYQYHRKTLPLAPGANGGIASQPLGPEIAGTTSRVLWGGRASANRRPGDSRYRAGGTVEPAGLQQRRGVLAQLSEREPVPVRTSATQRTADHRYRYCSAAERARATRSVAPAGPASAGRPARSGCFWLWAALSVARLAAPLVALHPLHPLQLATAAAAAAAAAAALCTSALLSLSPPPLPYIQTQHHPVARLSPPVFLLHSSRSTFAPLPLSPRSRPCIALDWLRLRPRSAVALERRPGISPLASPRLASPHPAHRLPTPRRRPDEQNKGPKRPFSRSRQLPHALLPPRILSHEFLIPYFARRRSLPPSCRAAVSGAFAIRSASPRRRPATAALFAHAVFERHPVSPDRAFASRACAGQPITGGRHNRS
ncbi:hypothetical protein CCMA1212_009666 [Trichoderma ghanense]|uniref:Uncharacterized protein n=1 Tax=Trichoderma ghanense TaxID=65468 RepID=A0ABY2GRA9_9HYPO